MMLLIGLESAQKWQQSFWATKLLKVIYLMLVVLVNKSFYRRNRSINGASAKHCGQSTCEPSS